MTHEDGMFERVPMQNSKNMIERMPSDCASLSLAAILDPMGLSSHCWALCGGIDTHPVLM